ncbi:late competence protein ComER [Cohnella sp. LGH]|uniref:Pyrroline-5-carboxylate reductase n=1 Tax=Cohnella phaseoli TaxID=456490 RepID=A0A3D9IRJ8_9BACL|nr:MULTISPECIES: late competence protein ComER [Cohnella]QTH46187.1 late competence protein ComER [Cohnella sp. LGH]RED64298.1 competence protein ComER [Cohnella phaseoli]
MKIGFIGAGSMGSLLVGAFVRSGAMRPDDIVVSSRTPSKLSALAEQYPGLHIAASNREAAIGADYLFLCVKPLDFRRVLEEIAPVLTARQIVVSITSPVKVASLEELTPSKVAKIIPSVVNAVGSGASLVMWGTRLTEDDKQELWQLFSSISRPICVPEDEVRVASDLSSCGPAFMACLLEQFIDAAVLSAGMERETATALACEMMLGTARLMLELPCTPAELQARVSVPGGITAVALESLRKSTRGAFLQVLYTTHEKFAEDLDRVDSSLFPRERT